MPFTLTEYDPAAALVPTEIYPVVPSTVIPAGSADPSARVPVYVMVGAPGGTPQAGVAVNGTIERLLATPVVKVREVLVCVTTSNL